MKGTRKRGRGSQTSDGGERLPSCVAVTLPEPVVLGAVEGGGASAVATRGGAEGIECVDLSLLPPRPPAIASRWPDLMER